MGRLDPPATRLKATGAAPMRRSGNPPPFLRSPPVRHRHKRRRVGLLKVIVHRLFQDRRREWPKGFSAFDPGVQNIFHLRTPWIGHDAPMTQRPGPPFHTTLEPAHHLPCRDLFGSPPTQLPLVSNFFNDTFLDT